jgi:hypothetical protein
MSNEKLTDWNKGFIQGFACACATMMREHDQPTMVEDCYRNNFNSIKQLREAGVAEFDLEVLIPIVKEIERKRSF